MEEVDDRVVVEGKVSQGQLVESQESTLESAVQRTDQEEGRQNGKGVHRVEGVEKRDLGGTTHGWGVNQWEAETPEWGGPPCGVWQPPRKRRVSGPGCWRVYANSGPPTGPVSVPPARILRRF